MIEIPSVTIALVTLAAFFYCTRFFGEILRNITKTMLSRYVERINELHDRARKEVETTFEFWWSGKPTEIVQKAILQEAPIPQEVLEATPDALLEAMISPAMNDYRSLALLLAVHARMTAEEHKITSKLPRLWLRGIALRNQADRNRDLDEARSRLTVVGIDINQLESSFSASADPAQ